MAKLTAGLFSTPSGHNNGLVFGKARTTEGKKVTVREYVVPTNPNTPAQEAQRSSFAGAVTFAKSLIPQLNERGWNGAVSNLPAFQSLMSITTPEVTKTEDALIYSMSKLTEVALGNLLTPPNVAASYTDPTLSVTWDTTSGPHSDPGDTINVVAWNSGFTESGYTNWGVVTDFSATRSAGSVDINFVSGSGDRFVMVWAESNQVGIETDSKFSETVVLAI